MNHIHYNLSLCKAKEKTFKDNKDIKGHKINVQYKKIYP